MAKSVAGSVVKMDSGMQRVKENVIGSLFPGSWRHASVTIDDDDDDGTAAADDEVDDDAKGSFFTSKPSDVDIDNTALGLCFNFFINFPPVNTTTISSIVRGIYN